MICIDDNSTDTSPKILKWYAEKYSYIEDYYNDQNLGLAQTRNLGIEKAEGRYILFVDSDDCLMPNVLGKLYDECYNQNLDVMEFDAESFADSQFECEAVPQKRIHKFQYDNSMGMQFMCRLIENNEMSGCVWMRMYRREYLLSHNIRFIRGILHEDIPFSFRTLIMAEYVGYYKKTIYGYRQRHGSIMHTIEQGQHWKGLWIGYMEMLCAWHEFLTLNSYGECYSSAIERYLDMILGVTKSYYNEYRMNHIGAGDCFNEYIDRKGFIDHEDLYDFFSTEDAARLASAEDLLLFGAGTIARKVIILLKKKEVSIRKIYVTQKSDNEDTVAGITVEQIDTYEQKDKRDVMVIAVSVNIQNEVERTIRRYYEGEIIKTTRV